MIDVSHRSNIQVCSGEDVKEAAIKNYEGPKEKNDTRVCAIFGLRSQSLDRSNEKVPSICGLDSKHTIENTSEKFKLALKDSNKQQESFISKQK